MTASGITTQYLLPYPLQTDEVDVAGDMGLLAIAIDDTLFEKAPLISPVFTGPVTVTGSFAATTLAGALLSAATPVMDSTASAGNSSIPARDNHVHPSDTSRSPVAGSASIVTVGTITTGTWGATAIGVTKGGTGLTSVTTGDLLIGAAANTVSPLSGIATGSALISGGITTAPSWGKIGLATHVSGTLPVANGGTGVTSSTGTGSVVLSSAPNITGGTIASATSITLTGAQTLAEYRVRNMYVSATDPGTGNDGDIWLKY